MNSEELPYWYKLLTHFENKGYVQNGLTIPFLIGSLEIVDPNAKQWSIIEMTESLNYIGCTILKCPNIGEFVIGSLEIEALKYRKYYHTPCDKIIVTDNSLDGVKSLAEITKLFIILYESLIADRKFSLNSGIWTYFTNIEWMRIKEVG
jgi:hypothetical protein